MSSECVYRDKMKTNLQNIIKFSTIFFVAGFIFFGFNVNSAEAAITISGTTNAGDGISVHFAVDGTPDGSNFGTTASGVWSISSATVTSGQIVVVWFDGVADASESTAVAKYDGTGDMTGIVLNSNVLSIGSVDDQSLTVADLDTSGTGYECTDDEDVMYDIGR